MFWLFPISQRSTVVKLDLTKIISVCRPNLLQMYIEGNSIGLVQELKKNEFINRLDILPSLPVEEIMKVNFFFFFMTLIVRRMD